MGLETVFISGIHNKGDFIRKNENVNIAVIVGDTEQIINDIQDYKIEMAIVGAKTDSTNITQKKLVEDNMRLIVPSHHKWALRDSIDFEMLFSEPFIIREKGSGTLQSVKNSMTRLGKKVQSLNIVAELGSTSAVIQGIKNNVGISILSPVAVQDDLVQGSLTALSINHLDLKRYFYLTTHKDRSASPLCKAFTEFLEKKLKP